MDWFQTFSLVFGLPALAMAAHELTHLAVGRIACPLSVECISWAPFRLRLDFDRMPSKATLRMIALAPLLGGSVVAVIAIQTGVWQQIQTADPYYLHRLVVGYWLLYIAPSSADLRLALWPRTERTMAVQSNLQ
jgi:hypothetical protein